MRLRVQDVDFAYAQLMVRMAKGKKDRAVPLPARLRPALEAHLGKARRLHERDLAGGFGSVYLPDALARKLPGAGCDWRWHYVFPASRLAADPRTGEVRRHHAHQSLIGKALREAARRADIDKRVTAHTLHHSFATDLLEAGKDVRTVQELLGHADVATTVIYPHVLHKGGLAATSPLDSL